MTQRETKLAEIQKLSNKIRRLSEAEQRAVSGGPKGPVPKSGASTCTYIPTQTGGGRCR